MTARSAHGARKAGRPSKLPAVQAKILKALKAGNWRGTACASAGIGQRTLREWMAQGRAKPDGVHGEFRRQVLAAEKSAEMRMVALVMRAAAKDARHAEWWLERKANPRWGRRDRLDHRGAVPVDDVGKLSDEALAESIAANPSLLANIDAAREKLKGTAPAPEGLQ